MKKLNLWMLATILFCGLTLTSCKDDDDVVSNVPAKDVWTELSQYMDTSVNPGDDFFMYCNGTWWKNTTVPVNALLPGGEIVGYTNDYARIFQEKVDALTLPTMTKFNADFDKMDQTSIQAQQLYDKTLKESGLETATTKEEVWKAAARLAKSGAGMMFRLYPFSKDGTIRLFIMKTDYDMADIPALSLDDLKDSRHSHLRKTHDANFIRSLKPVGDATRSLSESEWPMLATYVRELGINPEDVYTAGEYIQLTTYENDTAYASMTKEIRKMQEMTVKEFKDLTQLYFGMDTALVSSTAMAGVNAALEKNDMNLCINKSTVTSNLKKKYLTYDLSKEVGDKLVTADDILHGEQAVKELKEVFAERIRKNDWLSDAYKQNAIDKLNNMIVNVGRPDKWMSEGLTNIQSCTNVLEDLYSIRKTLLNFLIALNGKPSKQYSFHAMMLEQEPITLDEANAFYNPNYNSINLLPYYITAPWYSPTQNSAINYEAYNTFGHEITHGFDTNGSQFDKNGNPKTLWASEADYLEFSKRAKQLIDWYNTLDVLPDAPGLKANGDKTVSEDIADLGGMELAFQCYNNYLDKNGIKGEEKQLQLKRYFYAYAQEFRSKYTRAFVDYFAFGIDKGDGPDIHSMNKERVNGIVTNCDGWYETFGITSGKLYRKPAERVHIW